MDWQAYFDRSVLFSSSADPIGDPARWFAIAFGVILVAGVVARIIMALGKRTNPYFRRLLRQYFVWAVSFGLLGLLHTIAQEARIAFLGARLLVVLLVQVYVIWLCVLIYRTFVVYPRQRDEYAAVARRDQYLPRRRR